MTPAVSEDGLVEWRDVDMAWHWIDRYASGIDDEPQLDRILDCVRPTALSTLAPSAAPNDDPVCCTDCHGTGITDQTERRCACQGPALASPAEAAQPVAWLRCSKRDRGELELTTADAEGAFPVVLECPVPHTPPVAWMTRGIKPDCDPLPDTFQESHVGRLTLTCKGGPANRLWWAEGFPVYVAALPHQGELREGMVLVPRRLLETTEFWLTGALECASWEWDPYQHDAANYTADELHAALAGRAAG
jgi:hypothetical protein